VLWGVITFQWWGYWMAVAGAGLTTLLLAGVFVGSLTIGQPLWWVLLPLAIYAFVLWVLYTRREHFD
jgi:hypothetical protein